MQWITPPAPVMILKYSESILPVQLSAEMAPLPIVVNPSAHPLQGPPSGEYVPASIGDLTQHFFMRSQSGCLNGKLPRFSGYPNLSVSILLAINDINDNGQNFVL